MNRRPFIALFTFVFLFRLGFGLCESHWQDRLEQVQHYLVGLKYCTTGLWPYFGVDMFASESSYHSQLPGALFGLFIGLPLRLLHIPEAPFLWVNLLSASAAALLAWYIHQRLPALPFSWLFLWIAVAPWSLNYSTNVYNMSYLLLPSVFFFIGFLESIPRFSLGLVSLRLSNALMGFSLLWIMQFHFSYVLLLPFTALSLGTQVLKSRSPASLLYFTLGALPPAAFLLPTYFQYGFGGKTAAGAGFIGSFCGENFRDFPTLLARYLSLACSEIPRWIGAHTRDRLDFLESHPLLWIPGILLWGIGLVQPLLLFFLWFKKEGPGLHWREIKFLTFAALLMVWVSFWFTIKRPLSHQYLILFPLVMTYSCYCWARFKDRRGWALAAKAFILLSFLFQAGFAAAVAPKDSILTQRGLIQKSIDEKDYRILGERREGSFY